MAQTSPRLAPSQSPSETTDASATTPTSIASSKSGFKFSGLGDPIGDWRPVSVAAQRIENLAKIIGIRYRKSKPERNSRVGDGQSKDSISTSERKAQGNGFLHYKSWLSPPEPGKKRFMNLTIIEADGLQQSFVTRYIYVKILWKEEVFKTPPSAKATSDPHWDLSFKLEMNEGDTSTAYIEVWATRSMAADNLLGRTAFVPSLQSEDVVDVWTELFTLSSTSLKELHEITDMMIKRQHRVAKRAREHTPEVIMARRLEIRKKKAASIQAQKDAIIAAGWGDALLPVKMNKRRRIPISLKPYVPLFCLIGFVWFIVIIAFIPDELLTLYGY